MISEEKIIIDAVKKVSPAVVSVVISKHADQVKKMMSPFQPFEFLKPDKKDGKDKTEKPGDHDKSQHVQIGGGSGFIINSNNDHSLILTNKHVIHDQEAEYTVLLDDKEYDAEVLSSDPLNDIAMLKIKVGNLPTVKLGDSSKVQIGQTAIAIGTALGMFTNTVSKGIVSGLSRRIAASLGTGEETEVLRGVIQTDVAINQGNSGGPLINTDGEVVGINTAIIFGAQNIAFALPINWAKKDMDDILKHGRIQRPYLGLRYLMLNKKIDERMKLGIDHGALVVSDHLPNSKAVIPGSPAEKGGIKENDVILAINGKELDEKMELADLIQEFKIGEEVKMTLLRNNKETLKIKIKLEEMK